MTKEDHDELEAASKRMTELIVKHARNEALEEAALYFEGGCQRWTEDEVVAAIRALKTKEPTE